MAVKHDVMRKVDRLLDYARKGMRWDANRNENWKVKGLGQLQKLYTPIDVGCILEGRRNEVQITFTLHSAFS